MLKVESNDFCLSRDSAPASRTMVGSTHAHSYKRTHTRTHTQHAQTYTITHKQTADWPSGL